MKRKIRYDRIFGLLFIVCLIAGGIFLINGEQDSEKVLLSFVGKDVSDLEQYAKENNLVINVEKVYDDALENVIISQNVKEGTLLSEVSSLDVVVSLGKIDPSVYSLNGVNEVGRVPVMMYHGIHNLKNDDTGYTGGNVDEAGYQRTAEAFRNDLEFYYQEGYRMIRLDDYIDGKIDVPLGKSPIVLTFDDGLKNNMHVIGVDKEGNLEIDPNCAVGILEEFKKKYPDFQVTATFFLNGGLFQQPDFDEKIIKWLVDNGYDVGNHSYSHVNFTTIDYLESQEEIGRIYQMLDRIIPNQYVSIVALPFGSPYTQDHANFGAIMSGSYDGKEYQTKAALRVGWESDYSPFSKSFDPQFIKRIRAYDNNGVEFDIQMNFNNLKNTRYISDGDVDTVVVPEDDKVYVDENKNIKIVTY